MAEVRSRSEVLHGGSAASDLYAVPVSDHSGREGHPLRVRIRWWQSHGPHDELHRVAGGQLDGVVERPVGRRHAGHRGEELQRSVVVRPGGESSQRCAHGDRALRARARREHHRLRGADRGPKDVYAALDDPHAALPPAGAERPVARVQLRRILGRAALRRREKEDSWVNQDAYTVGVKIFRIVAAATLLVAAAVPVVAHHSFAAEFDANKPVTIKGTVVKMEWSNPHSWIHIEVKGPDGKVERWAVEGGAPNALIRRGWNKNSLAVGIEIVVDGFQAKDGSNRANGRDITFPDGKKLFVGSSGTGAPYEKKDRQ